LRHPRPDRPTVSNTGREQKRSVHPATLHAARAVTRHSGPTSPTNTMPSTALPSGSSRQTVLSRHSKTDPAPICALGNYHQRPANQSTSRRSRNFPWIPHEFEFGYEQRHCRISVARCYWFFWNRKLLGRILLHEREIRPQSLRASPVSVFLRFDLAQQWHDIPGLRNLRKKFWQICFPVI
jgi:hypothetical protein